MRQNKFINTIKGTALAAASLAMLAGCNDFLDITPQSTVSPETYLVQEAQLAAYTIRYYTDNFPTSDDQYGADLTTDMAARKVDPGTRYVPGNWRTPATGGEWAFSRITEMNYYLNIVVPRMEAGEISGIEANIRHYVGEGYFIRAWQYFFRLRRLGDFPIITETLPDNMEALVAASERKPRNEVARFILGDLDKAIELLSATPPGGKVRPSKNAALALKARVALYEATWLKYHKGTAMVPGGPGWPGAAKSYNSGFSYAGGSIDTEINWFLDQAMAAAEQVADVIPLTENNGLIQDPTQPTANQYYDMMSVQNPASYAEVLFFRQYDRSLQSYSSGYNHHIYFGAQRGYTHGQEQTVLMANGLPIYAPDSGYAGDDYIVDTKVGRDSRWRLFMKAPGEYRAWKNTASPVMFEATPEIWTNDGKTTAATGYNIGKGYSLDFNDSVVNQDQMAAVLLRAAEAYLIYIEAYYEKNGNIAGKADTYWKAIRTRAGVDTDYNKTITATDMNIEAQHSWAAYSKGQLVDATLYNIRRERATEFIGEGYRYDDLCRWRSMDQLATNPYHIQGLKLFGPMRPLFDALPENVKYDQAAQRDNTVSSPSLGEYLYPFRISTEHVAYNGLRFIEAHYLYPIANEHFRISSSDGSSVETSPIYQNPGWPIEANSAPN
jgi:hypothetical protein